MHFSQSASRGVRRTTETRPRRTIYEVVLGPSVRPSLESRTARIAVTLNSSARLFAGVSRKFVPSDSEMTAGRKIDPRRDEAARANLFRDKTVLDAWPPHGNGVSQETV